MLNLTIISRGRVARGADLFVLLGDDVRMLSDDWQADVEANFAAIARERDLPYGCGCVAGCGVCSVYWCVWLCDWCADWYV